MDAGERFQVKPLMVKPGHALSLQLHRKRAEHWVVVSGRARVTRVEEPLLIIEAQSGSYRGDPNDSAGHKRCRKGKSRFRW